ncbi:DUF3168 domain-containing protein [Mesorhizobium sp. SB112]|uniref:DUF3168 domain-containing protein n=1 Tax=Mesorhizobium sp. SB112 TaxID=3151853 RepID=UPI003267A290
MSAAADLQKAIFDCMETDEALIAALGGSRIFDHVPVNAQFPYISFGRTSMYDWSTSTEHGSEQFFTLHIWSKDKGKRQALDILELAKSRLETAALEPAAHHLVNLIFDFAEVRQNEDLSLYHGLLRYRAVLEPR